MSRTMSIYIYIYIYIYISGFHLGGGVGGGGGGHLPPLAKISPPPLEIRLALFLLKR